MPTIMSESKQPTPATLSPALEGADSAQIAEAMASTWLSIEATLAPIIGHRGVEALFDRSLHLTARSHPWLSVLHRDGVTGMDVAALKPLFAGQARAVAAAGASLLLRTFHELLSTLIGLSLTERLLRPVLATILSDSTAQDISP